MKVFQRGYYTRPAEYNGMKVPDVLLSGNHKEIQNWRKEESLKRTRIRRRDLLNLDKSADLDIEEY